jgi:uncharacterized protein (TIGR00266 family)
MQMTIRHDPSFSAVRVALDPGETLKVESGAMMAHSSTVHAEAKADGGMMKSLKRAALGGESLFITTYTADHSGGWVDVAPYLPGDIKVVGVDVRGVALTRGSWLASAASVDLDTKWGGVKNLAGGEGGFLVNASGSGHLALSCYGAADTLQVPAGEQVVVDSGHVVAFDPGIGMELTKASKGIVTSLKSGEGVVFRFTGPGWVMTQTRNPSALIDWLTKELPFSRQ